MSNKLTPDEIVAVKEPKSKEIWKTIPFATRYEASTLGRVRSKRTHKVVSARMRAYPVVMLLADQSNHKKWATHPFQLHRCVAHTFFTVEALSAFAMVRHIDGDRTNNALSNLALGSAQDNANDCKRLGHIRFGARSARAKLTNEVVAAARYLYNSGAKACQIAWALGMVDSSISRLLCGETYPVTDLPLSNIAIYDLEQKLKQCPINTKNELREWRKRNLTQSIEEAGL